MELIHEINRESCATSAKAGCPPWRQSPRSLMKFTPSTPRRGSEAIRLFRSYNFPILPEHARPKALVAIASIDDDLTARIDIKRSATGLAGRTAKVKSSCPFPEKSVMGRTGG